MATKTKLYAIKAINLDIGKYCFISAYIDEGEALQALEFCQNWMASDPYEDIKHTFECRKYLDRTEKYGLRYFLATYPTFH